MKTRRTQLACKRFSWEKPHLIVEGFRKSMKIWQIFFAIGLSAMAQEITVFNFSGDNVNAGPLTFPVGETHFDWPYSQTNWVFNYRRVTYAFPVDQDFHLHIDRQRVIQTLVMSSTEWFFMGFGLAMTIAGYFWVIRIVNQLFRANPEVP